MTRFKLQIKIRIVNETNGKQGQTVETEPIPSLLIRAQTKEEEVERISQTIARKDWFERHGYKPVLPLSAIDHASTITSVDEEYDQTPYLVGISKLQEQQQQIQICFPIFAELRKKWGFIILPSYQVLITRYGMGGSYYCDTGNIIMRVDQQGLFAREQPYHTVIHEMVHIGIETFVQQCRLTQQEKERTVDLILAKRFEVECPNYRIQNIGDERVEEFITTQAIGTNLPEALKSYITKYPRDI